ncbi:hypothetical protein ACEPPN_010938 [Leptodophora sp. 'Broadleaf-Isolate-01']
MCRYFREKSSYLGWGKTKEDVYVAATSSIFQNLTSQKLLAVHPSPSAKLFKISNYVSDVDLIRNTTARYAFIVDAQTWDDLHSVFTPDADIHFTWLGDHGKVTGVENIGKLIGASAANTVSQHSLSTQSIEVTGADTAVAKTYVTVLHEGTETHRCPGERFNPWGWYGDKLVKTKVDGKEDWRIVERLVKLNLPLGGNIDLLSSA